MQEHPVNEALFNLVNVWSLMLWPLMLADKKGAKVKNKFGIYLGTQVQSMSPVGATASIEHGTKQPYHLLPQFTPCLRSLQLSYLLVILVHLKYAAATAAIVQWLHAGLT